MFFRYRYSKQNFISVVSIPTGDVSDNSDKGFMLVHSSLRHIPQLLKTSVLDAAMMASVSILLVRAPRLKIMLTC